MQRVLLDLNLNAEYETLYCYNNANNANFTVF